jgi:hypothetical protein
MPTRRQFALSALGLAGLGLAIPLTKAPTVYYRLRAETAPELDPRQEHIVFRSLQDLWAFWAPVGNPSKFPHPYQIDRYLVSGPVVRRVRYEDPTLEGVWYHAKEGDGPEESKYAPWRDSTPPRWTAHTLYVVEGRHLQRA